MQRRAFIKALAAGAAVGAFSPMAHAALPKGRVLVVGGGYAGATAAKYLKMWGGEQLEVILIERNTTFVSCPLSNLVLGGSKHIGDLTFNYSGLDRHVVKRLHAEVTGIDPAQRKVFFEDGDFLDYDRLVIAPGIDFMYDALPMLESSSAQEAIPHAWKAGPQTVNLRRQLEAMPDGGVFAIGIPKAPYRCPPGPYERACMVAAYLKQHKPKSKVLVLDANPEIQSKKALFEKAYAQHYAGILEYRANSELKEVQGKVAKLEFEDVKADVLNVVPPQRAGDIAKSTGLINVNQRWSAVNWLTMESTAVAGVHVLGDATFPGPGMPKSGHMANQHAKVAAAAIIQLLKGEAVNSTPVVMNTCYSFVTARDVIHVASVHQYDAADKVFKPVPGSGGVSAAANQIEGRYALSWAQNIWDDMLAGTA